MTLPCIYFMVICTYNISVTLCMILFHHSPHFKGQRIESENVTDNKSNKSWHTVNHTVGSNHCMGPLSLDATYYVFLVSCIAGHVCNRYCLLSLFVFTGCILFVALSMDFLQCTEDQATPINHHHN